DGIRAFRVTGVQTCALPIFAVPRLDGVAARILHGEVPQRHAIGGDQEPLRATALVGEGEDGTVLSGAADGDIVDVERKTAGQFKPAAAQADGVAGTGLDQRGLQLLLGPLARLYAPGPRLGGANEN